LNPRGCRVVALGTPSDVEKTQWYLQRYVAHLPAAGEIVLFDRSWYNRGCRAGDGFCTEEQYQEFMQSCPEFERMLARSGIVLLKYWFSVSDEEQERRFQARVKDPATRWNSARWISTLEINEEYSKAKDATFAHTIFLKLPGSLWKQMKKTGSPQHTSHILSIQYLDITPEAFQLPPRKPATGYVRPPINEQFFVPQVY